MVRSDEVERILQNMKDIVNEFCTVNKKKEEKKRIRDAFVRSLRNMHSYIKAQMAKDPAPSQGNWN